jgi:hypothetical protein
MHLDRLARHPERHLVDGDLGRGREKRVGKRVGRGAGAAEARIGRLTSELPRFGLTFA